MYLPPPITSILRFEFKQPKPAYDNQSVSCTGSSQTCNRPEVHAMNAQYVDTSCISLSLARAPSLDLTYSLTNSRSLYTCKSHAHLLHVLKPLTFKRERHQNQRAWPDLRTVTQQRPVPPIPHEGISDSHVVKLLENAIIRCVLFALTDAWYSCNRRPGKSDAGDLFSSGFRIRAPATDIQDVKTLETRDETNLL